MVIDRGFMSGHLFFKSTGHQPPELRQAMVDPVSAPLLYDLSKKSRGTVRANQNNRTKEIKIQGYNPLTPLLFFRARICEALPGDMDPVTGLYHGERERNGDEGNGRMVLARKETFFILLHIVIITLLNMTQRQDDTSSPFNLISFLGTEQQTSARERREDEIVLGLMRF